MPKRVLNVGHCSFDHGSVDRLISSSFDAKAESAPTCDAALAMLRRGRFDLVLVNRILAGDATEGRELIRQMKADPELAAIPVMLVSNHAEAQEAAIAAGAEPGFGKAELDRPETVEKLGRFLD